MNVRIRPMTTTHLRAVIRIERASFSAPWTLTTFRGLLSRRDSHLSVAEQGPEHDPEVIGYAIFWRVEDQAELGDLAVDPAQRRRGIGRALLEHVIEHAGRLGVRELFLEVRESNRPAQSLYAEYGFETVGRRAGYYSSPSEDALVLLRRARARELAGVAEVLEGPESG